MFVDASAIVAILYPEHDGPVLVERLATAPRIFVSAVCRWEATVALARLRPANPHSADRIVADFMRETDAEIIPIDAAVGDLAIDAFVRFGKGRHPAALNMGDCFAYACAKSRALPILCKGDDFARTDALLA